MSARDDLADLVRRRAERVAVVSALTAKALKITQALAGSDMEIQRCELEIAQTSKNGAPDNRQLLQDLLEAKESAEVMREVLAVYARDIETAEEDVADLDRSIAAARGV